MKHFGLIGGAGYIAPRHMKAIKSSGHDLVALCDPCDSVGIMDSYFPKAEFFTKFEQFDQFLSVFKKENKKSLDYISITSPNYLHDSHIQYALRMGSDAICEKPLVLSLEEIDLLDDLQKETGKNVWNILQLRLHPSIVELREQTLKSNQSKKFDVDLTYITSRGKWYLNSWKGNELESGGIAFNIGIHFFDMLSFVFGKKQSSIVHLKETTKSAGYLEYEKARVRWFLSIDENDLPKDIKEKNQRTFRCIRIDDKELEFSKGFTDLHDESYNSIIKGEGYSLQDARSCIETASEIYNLKESPLCGDYHPYLKNI